MISQYTISTAKKGLLLILKSSGIALVSVAALVFMAQKIGAKSEEIAKTRTAFAASAKKYEVFDQLKKDNEFANTNIGKLRNALPSPDNVTIIADYLTTIGVQTNTISSIRFDPNVNQEALAQGAIPFTIQIAGARSSFLEMLKKIESSPYLIEITALSLNFPDSQNNISAILTGIAHTKPYEEN